MSKSTSKDYIESVYKRHSNFAPIYEKKRQFMPIENFTAPIVKKHGLYFSQSPSPYGPPTESLDEAMFEHTFQDLYNRSNYLHQRHFLKK